MFAVKLLSLLEMPGSSTRISALPGSLFYNIGQS